ncbi:MAG: hypothetical protein JWN95_3701 [Frankiales bacterium]|nr:hypothetical protein [Frankiales bacterium]
MSDTAERITVSRVIPADASSIFSLITSPKGHVAIDGSGMLVTTDDTAAVTGVGDSFDIAMHQEAFGDYTIKNVITVFEPDSALEWRPGPVGGDASGVVYGYTLSPQGDATQVTSYYDWSDAAQQMKDMGILPIVSQANIEETLVKLEGAATS